jgi:hypothetical protein
MKTAWIILGSIAGSVMVILLLLPGPEEEGQAKLFCSYDKVFVEFDDGNYKWGTMFLDDDGKPISCSKNYLQPNGKMTRKYNDQSV